VAVGLGMGTGAEITAEAVGLVLSVVEGVGVGKFGNGAVGKRAWPGIERGRLGRGTRLAGEPV
jgi:hypothetical protein